MVWPRRLRSLISRKRHKNVPRPIISTPIPENVQEPSKTSIYELCDDCKQLDFEEEFERYIIAQHGVFICELPHISANSTCKLCRFFAAVANYSNQRSEQNIENKDFHLQAFPISRLLRPQGRQIWSVFPNDTVLAVMPGRSDSSSHDATASAPREKYDDTVFILPTKHSTYSMNERYTGRQLSPSRIDFDLVCDWIHKCHTDHGRKCHNHKDVSISGFRLIDCFDRSIDLAPGNCSYIALSYVWGQHNQNELQGILKKLPAICPRVIADAMYLAVQLKIQYLWVDRYCINQDDEVEKHGQISKMDSIYANAELTIIAAAGDDHHYGLPGVNATERKPQPSIQLPCLTLVSSLENPRHIITDSAWMTRGWTYQEGLLSRRRLIFTDQQVYFQCSSMHCFESVSTPAKVLASMSEHNGIFANHQLYPSKGFADEPKDFLQRINEYADKSLSYEGDILKAVAGVLRVFESSPVPFRHIWGLPLYPISLSTTDRAMESLIASLTWQVEVEGDEGDVMTRRDGFPSWSWVGWANWHKFSMPWLRYLPSEKAYKPDFDMTTLAVESETRLRHEIDWSQPRQELPDLSDCSPILHLTAWAVKLQLIRTYLLPPHGGLMPGRFGWSIAKPETSEDMEVSISITSTEKLVGDLSEVMDPNSKDLLIEGILLGCKKSWYTLRSGAKQSVVHLLIVEADKECYTRIGTANFALHGDFIQQSELEASIGDTAFHRKTFRLG
jgi:hypothetical protein